MGRICTFRIARPSSWQATREKLSYQSLEACGATEAERAGLPTWSVSVEGAIAASLRRVTSAGTDPKRLGRTGRWRRAGASCHPGRHETLLRITRSVVTERLIPLLDGSGQSFLPGFCQEIVKTLLVGPEGAELGTGTDSGPEAHDLHLSVDHALVESQQIQRHTSDSLRHLEYTLFQPVRWHAFIRPPEPSAFHSRKRIARQHHFHGLAHANEPGMEVVVGHAEADGWISHLRIVGDIDQIATRGELAPASKAVAVHLGDHRLGELPDTHPALRYVPRPMPFAGRREPREFLSRVSAPQVVSRREGATRTPEHHDAYLGILIRLLQRRDDLAAESVVQGIALLGAIERDPSNLRGRLVQQYECVGHWRRPFSAVSAWESCWVDDRPRRRSPPPGVPLFLVAPGGPNGRPRAQARQLRRREGTPCV